MVTRHRHYTGNKTSTEFRGSSFYYEEKLRNQDKYQITLSVTLKQKSGSFKNGMLKWKQLQQD